MPETTPPTGTLPTTPVTPPAGSDPTNTNPGAPTNPVDLSALSDDQFSKVFDDKRLWEHPRFKQLNEAAKKAAELEATNKKAEEDRLAKQGEWETLAKQREEEAKTATQRYQDAMRNNAIYAEAAKSGVVDVDAVTKLIDSTNIKIGEDGTVTGVAEAVAALLAARPYLKGATPVNPVGTGTNPPADGSTTPRKFKLSELQNPVFYQEHKDEIAKAMKLGLVENDMK